MRERVVIIAEAGVNHNGDYKVAVQLIDAAASAGADIVKFQTSIPNLGLSKYAKKAEYQVALTDRDESFLEMCQKLILPFRDYKKLKTYCGKKGIKFLSTPFDIVSIKYLHKLGVDCFKIPSGEIRDVLYLREIAKLHKRIILSTGMAYMSEIHDALEILTANGLDKSKIAVLHCNTAYPTPYEDVNLNAMKSIRDKCGVKVGYSDHTLGIEVSIAAVALGAQIIEKHLTLDRNMQGPDHQSSLEPDEFREMVHAIRNIEKTLGDGVKEPSSSERKNIGVARKSIVAAVDIKKGQMYTSENLAIKRPGTGIDPMKYDYLLGESANRDYFEDELIETV